MFRRTFLLSAPALIVAAYMDFGIPKRLIQQFSWYLTDRYGNRIKKPNGSLIYGDFRSNPYNWPRYK